MKNKLLFLQLVIVFIQLYGIDYSLQVQNEEMLMAGTPFRIDLEIRNSGKVKVELLNKNDQVSVREAGTSTSFSLVNGVQSLSVTHSYIAQANSPGSYQIGPFKLVNKDKTIETEIKNITVQADQTQRVSQSVNNNPEYMLLMVSDKNEIVESGFVDVSVYFLHSVEVRVNNYKPIELPKDAWIENIMYGEESRGRKSINNKIYEEYLIENKRIFINKSGTYTVSPPQIDFYIFTRSSMFSYYSTPVSLSSKPLSIKVNPLPSSENDNNKYVGKFNLSFSVNSNEVIVNNPLSMKIILEGEGNYHSIPTIDFDTSLPVEIFSSNSEEIKSANKIVKKVWDILLLPIKPGTMDIKLKPFTFFDTDENKFVTITNEAMTVQVTGKLQDNDVNVSTYNNLQEEEIKKIEYFIDTELANNIDQKAVLFNFYAIIYLYLLCFLLFFITAICILIKKTNFTFSSCSPQQILLKKLKTDLQNIKLPLPEKIKNLHANLLLYISKKTNIPLSEITLNSLNELFNSKGNDEFYNIINEILKEIDYMRFSSASYKVHVVEELYLRIISYIEEGKL